MKVLVTGAGALLGQGIIRSLTDSKLVKEIVACDPSPLATGLYWTKQRRLIPMAKDPGYLPAIKDLLRSERPDAVLVGTDVELSLFAQHRAELEAEFSTRVVVSSPEVVDIADDKYKTYQFLTANGFPAPRSCLPGKEDELVAQVGFPLIVKPRVGARSVGVSQVNNVQELRHALATADGLVVQECVSSGEHEYTAGALVFDGRCEATIVMRRDLRDGNTYRAYVEEHPELNDFVRRVAEALGAYGPVNFQFRLADGVAKIFEINGRFSGTTPLRARAGFNEVEMVLRKVCLNQPVEQPQIVPMTILRYITEEVVMPEDVVK